MLPLKMIIQLILIILFSFIFFNTIHLLPTNLVWVQSITGVEKYQVENNSCISTCLLHLENISLPLETGSSQSLCGYTANSRGNHQKVVSCSFYGDMKLHYFQGIKDNLDLMEERI